MTDVERVHWFKLIRNEARYYVRHRRWIALARALWLRVILHDNVENCLTCGRRYPFAWMADDGLYQRLIGHAGGQFCPRCFDHMADRTGLVLVWQPRVWIDNGVEHDIAAMVGAFRD